MNDPEDLGRPLLAQEEISACLALVCLATLVLALIAEVFR